MCFGRYKSSIHFLDITLMKSDHFAIVFTTCFLIFYTVSAQLGMPAGIVATMFFISPYLVITMVYRVLRYGKPNSNRTFDQQYYADIANSELGII